MNILCFFTILIIVSSSFYPAFALDTPQTCDTSILPPRWPSSHIYVTDTNESLPYVPLTDHIAIFHDDDVWNTSTYPRTVHVTLTIQDRYTGQQIFNQTQSLQMQACSGPESVKWRFVPTQVDYYIATVSDDRGSVDMGFNSMLDTTKSQTVSLPLEQLRFGILPKDIQCKPNLALVFKAEDGLPACVKYTTANILIERGWAKETISDMTGSQTTVIFPVNSSNTEYGLNFMPSVVKTIIGTNNTVRWINMDGVANDITSNTKSFSSGIIESGYAWAHTFDKTGTYNYHSDIHPWLKGTVIVTANPMANLNDNAGIVALGNQTYYFETPNYTKTAYVNPIQISFHNVLFTLFPSGFRGGLPNPCGQGSGQYYWADAKFADGTHELLHIFAWSQPCTDNPIPTMFSNHTSPQAGLTFYDGKMKLLVSENQTTGSLKLSESFEPCDIPYPQSNDGIAVLYMPVNSTGKICVQYSNSNPPQPTGIRIFEAHHIMEDTNDVTSYATPDVIPTGNSTIVYTITTKNHVGFYGLTIFCVGMPFAVGYDNNSNFVGADFPWLGGTYYCPAQLYNYHITGLSGIGVKHIPYP